MIDEDENISIATSSYSPAIKQKGGATAPTSPVVIQQSKQFLFPGSDSQTMKARNLWRAKYLDSLFHQTRLKRYNQTPSNFVSSGSWYCSLIIVTLYLPIGLVLLFLRVILGFPIAGILSNITPRFCSTCIFRSFACCCYGNVYRYKRVLPTTEEELNIEKELMGRPAPIMVANHSTEMDVLPIRSRGHLRIMGYDMYTKMKFLQCSPLKFLDMLYIKQTERSAGGGKDRDNVRQQVINGLAEKDAPPLLVFPEGGLTSGKAGLLQFHKFLFSLNYCVQPIVIKAHGGPLPINIDNNFGTTWGNILYFTFQPWQTFTVTYLPPAKRRSNEDPLDFAQRVMSMIAKERGISTTPFLYREKRIYSKMKMELYEKGFRYRFVRNSKVNGRIHPEALENGKDDLPMISLRSQCGCCCSPNIESLIEEGNIEPLDYLANCIEKAFTDEKTGKSKSQIFEILERKKRSVAEEVGDRNEEGDK
jgi:ancient ubiquitous protein 1